MTALADLSHDASFGHIVASVERIGANQGLPSVIALYRGWIDAQPDHQPLLHAAWFNLGVELSRAKQGVDAAEAYRASLRLKPDFHPAANRLRVLGTDDANFRHTLSALPTPATTGTTADGTFAYPTGTPNPNLVAAAYTNSFNDTGKLNSGLTTTLYSIDADQDALITHPAAGAPAFNTLQTVGALGVDVMVGKTGFDIAGAGTAVLSRAGASSTDLYTVDLTSGKATMKGSVKVALSSVALKLQAP